MGEHSALRFSNITPGRNAPEEWGSGKRHRRDTGERGEAAEQEEFYLTSTLNLAVGEAKFGIGIALHTILTTAWK